MFWKEKPVLNNTVKIGPACNTGDDDRPGTRMSFGTVSSQRSNRHVRNAFIISSRNEVRNERAAVVLALKCNNSLAV
jgi:hypothetical protein